MKILKVLYRQLSIIRQSRDFDPEFYLHHYDDLKSLRTYWQARTHYVRHGKAEGRFPNQKSYLQSGPSAIDDLRRDFDVVAYRFYNKDVAYRFRNEDELFGHYLRHGREEGRLCRFPEDNVPAEALPDAEKWKSIFSIADFLAWCGSELALLPKSRREALEVFSAQGIDRLWPISFEYSFDADFVRANNLMPHRASDADMYRAWLTEGFPKGVSPNEQHFLAPYLEGAPVPLAFDWKAFARRAGLPGTATRSRSLIALFEQPAAKIVSHIDLMGQDAPWLLDRIGQWALSHGAFSKAVMLLEQSIAINRTAAGLCSLGDAQRGLGATSKVLETYIASTDMDQAPLAAFLEAATIHAAHGAFPDAFAMLRKAFPAWRQKAIFGDKLHDVVRLYFEQQSAQAHALYQEAVEGDDATTRTLADQLLTHALDQIQSLYRAMDALPPSTGGQAEGYVAILANNDLRQCTHYRIEQKILQFEHAGIPVKYFSHADVQGFMDSLIGARAAIFYRVAAVPAILRAILHANGMGLDTYYEIDDLLFDPACYPDPLPSFEGQISAAEYAGLQFGVPLFRYAMGMCRGSIASTPALLERMQAASASGAGIVIRNGLDRRNEAAIAIGAHPIRPRDGRLRIFYGSGTKAHNADFNMLVGPPLLDLMRRHPHVDLVIVGHLKLRPEFQDMQGRVSSYPFIADMTAYWSVLASCHINLAVLAPGAMADCKSEIKWLEAAMVQVPSIVSGTQTYGEVISDGVDGFIARSQADWRDALERLVTQPQLRDRVGAEARTKALRDYSLEACAQALGSTFATPYRDSVPSPARPHRLRILICNVFFAPQSYGGATRVVEDNVRDFLAHYPDLEIGIFCSDEGAGHPGRLRLDGENGVPVYRLSTPQEADMDRRPFNDDHVAPFEQVLDHFRPDVIHFHCIQRLTATIVEVALRRHIPYVVTLHDGWWISDDQFLVGKDGLRVPDTDVMRDCAGAPAPLTSIARRQRLASLLLHAQANLSVSASFAKIYGGAGIPSVVIENGVPAMEKAIRTPRSDGRVALGHLGGRSAHKGAALIEATLRRGQYRNLHLTMVDGTLAPGQSVDLIWGMTPVTLLAPCSQSQVAQIYSQLDVLLAPSTWPESYGLVTREALNSGLWVVASDLGAIGQDVVDGHNGYRIDVSTAKDLSETLSKIDSDPEKYRTSPPRPFPQMRSMADQADELHSLYLRIIHSG